MSGWQFIQNPGPTNLPDEVRAALARPAVDFGTPQFAELLQGCLADLGGLLDADPAGELYLHTASGHGGWEAALVNLFEPGEVVLAPDHGRFSRAWGEMAAALGLEVQWLPADWRRALPPSLLAGVLDADRSGRIAGVLLTHTETSTGVTNDVAALVAAMRSGGHRALALVDAVASFGTTELRCHAWDLDVVVTASQKGLMLAPGLAIIAAGPRAVARAAEVRRPRSYWAWPQRNATDVYHRFSGTPPVQLVHALRVGLDLLAAEGLDGVIARHHRLAAAVRAAVEHWAGAGTLRLFAAEPAARSDAVTCVELTAGHDPVAVRRCLRERWHVSIGGGLSDLAATTFRVGHLGALNEPMILGVLGALEGALPECGISITEGGVVTAVGALRAVRTAPTDDGDPITCGGGTAAMR